MKKIHSKHSTYFILEFRYERLRRTVCGNISGLANNSVSQLRKAATLCIDDHQLKKAVFEGFGELATVGAQIALLEVVDLTFCGQSTHSKEQSQSGTERATKDWQD